jgi:hypothetical protein
MPAKAPELTSRPDQVIEAYKLHVDRSLLRENLKLSLDERMAKLQRMVNFAAELQRAGRESRGRS